MLNFVVKLYDASLRRHCNREPQHDRQEVEVHIIGSAVRQIFHFFEGGQLKVIGISGYRPVMVREALKDQSVKRGLFNLVISVRVQEDYGICEVQNSIAQEIHRITGTDISLPIDEALKPYNFLLFLDCRNQIIDLHDLKIPEHGSVVLASRLGNVYNIMLVDHEIRMEDHQRPWSFFWKNVANFPFLKIEPIASQLVELCHSHLLAFILLTRALKAVTDVRVWQHALGELSSSSFSPLMKGRSHEVMVVVLKLVWEREGIVTRHCIKHLCTSVTKDIKLEKTS
ncbi:putative disease resistance protein [Camellia lanceoleosa]|uniref:Disease resistance protein n=1 Tax=Camellia lanceoleosa TaxID=1840588 RepID=A0ACC0GQP8_9ERIC|nr:putative disease resistance protein [Camellia lanceoleosa]